MIDYEDTDLPKMGEWTAPAGFIGRPSNAREAEQKYCWHRDVKWFNESMFLKTLVCNECGKILKTVCT